MSEWKEYRLGDIGKIVTGKTPKTAITDNYGGNIPFLSPSDNMELKYVPITARHLTEKGLAEVKSCLIPENSVCVSCIGSNMGKSVITVRPIVTNQQINSIIPSSNFDTNFLYYILQNKKREIKFLGRNGTAVPILNKSAFSNLTILAPELDEQRSIASILSSLDSKIENNRKICANLEAQAQALFKHWFIDFAPFKDGKFVESELGMIPEGWRVGSPYEFLDFIYGAPYKSNLFNDKKEGLPLIRIRDLKDCSPQFYTPEVLPKSEYVKAGDILAGMDAEFAPYIWKGQQGLLNQRVCKIKPKSKEIGRFFCMLLVKPQLLFVQAVKTGTTVSHIGKSDIDRFKVILPPLNEVIRFSKLGEEILDEIITVSAESSRLSSLRDTLLPKLMSGEIKV